MLCRFGEICDPKFRVAPFSSPAVDHFDGLSVNKQATKYSSVNVEIPVYTDFDLPIASEPFFLDADRA